MALILLTNYDPLDNGDPLLLNSESISYATRDRTKPQPVTAITCVGGTVWVKESVTEIRAAIQAEEYKK